MKTPRIEKDQTLNKPKAEFTAVTHVPISQLPPEYPEAHLQIYESFLVAVQTPPFRQGLLSHGPTAVEQKKNHSIKHRHTFVAMDELFKSNISNNLLWPNKRTYLMTNDSSVRPNRQYLYALRIQLLHLFLPLWLKIVS